MSVCKYPFVLYTIMINLCGNPAGRVILPIEVFSSLNNEFIQTIYQRRYKFYYNHTTLIFTSSTESFSNVIFIRKLSNDTGRLK